MDSHAVECFIILLKTPTTYEAFSAKNVGYYTHLKTFKATFYSSSQVIIFVNEWKLP